MFGPKWLTPFLSFLFVTNTTASSSPFQNQKPWDPCPIQCGLVGPDSQDWGVYHDLDALDRCDRPLLMKFALQAPVDGPTKVQACSIWGDTIAASGDTPSEAVFLPENVIIQRLPYGAMTGRSQEGARALFHLQTYLHAQVQGDSNSILFIKSGQTVIGFFGGSQIDNSQLIETFISDLVSDFFVDESVSGVLEQVCGTDRNAKQTTGVVISFDGSLSAVQDTVHTWSQGTCVQSTQDSLPITPLSASSSSRNTTIYTSNNQDGPSTSTGTSDLQRRASCSTIQINAGDTCTSLATRCGVTYAQFTTYNTATNLCSKPLTPGDHVCCSSGTRPDFTPKQNSDGSCHSYSVHDDDNCSQIAAANDLTVVQLETFNKNTWGWNGCDVLWAGTKMCLSTGTPPMPAPLANAVCGPQVPGTKAPTDGSDIALLNPCPLNACCDIWGQCGTTAEFCTSSIGASGAPGTARAKENGCISNCGTLVVTSDPPAAYQKIAYFEGYNFGRPCLNMDVTQVDTDTYTHIHFGFGTLDQSFNVLVGDDRSQYEFETFKSLSGIKRILSIGGWAFSTSPSTYMIFRNAVLPENRFQAAQNIADFVYEHGLDGVDIDWEYPGATDTGVPPADAGEGSLYATFLFILKSKLLDKSVSIAAPASYWYLRAFPMNTIGTFVDYIVYMTYDLHGQWDYDNQWSISGCPAGNCLRSHVNLTETLNALSMITKSGAPSNKIYVGVSSYGRSFKMTTPGCTGPMCTYVGKASDAAQGRCTQTNGYISNAEIDEIIATNPSAQSSTDTSFSSVVVYNSTEYVAYMDDINKAERNVLYSSLNFAGTVDWAIDLGAFHTVPDGSYDDINNVPVTTWGSFIELVDKGKDPEVSGPRSGNWSSGAITCDDDAMTDVYKYSADVRWSMLDCDDAFDNAVTSWKKQYPNEPFVGQISNFLHGKTKMNCGILSASSGCGPDAEECDSKRNEGKGKGPAGVEVLNSFISIHNTFQDFYDAIGTASDDVIFDVDKFFKTFAPIPDNTMAINILFDALGLIIPSAMGPIFNSHLKSNDYFTAHPNRLDTAKDVSFTLVGTWVNLMKDTNPGTYGWSEEAEWDFKSYMGGVWRAWRNSTEQTSIALFDGSDVSIGLLTRLIKDGQQITGSSMNQPRAPMMTAEAMADLVKKCFYAFIIPLAWQKSGKNIFVIDTGHACDGSNPVPDYVYDADAKIAGACFQEKQYYLMYPNGYASDSCKLVPTPECGVRYRFSLPPGIETLGQGSDEGTAKQSWVGLSVSDIIASTVNSYVANGNKNGWDLKGLDSYSNDRDTATKQLKTADLINQNIAAAGYNTIPMCSAEEAFANWGVNMNLKNYPCNDN